MKLHKQLSRSFATACISIFLVSGLIGCASGGAHNTQGRMVTDVELMESFSRGEIRLKCRTSCSGAQGGNRRAMKNLHYDQSWGDLVKLVTTIGFENDLNYYFLGRSAEGEGYAEAAKIYYELALDKKIHKCAGLLNNCDGFVFPRDIQVRLDKMSSNTKNREW
jgi:hypothetical protein